MKVYFAVCALVIASAAGMALMVSSKASNMKRFVYEEATPEEQEAWLYRQAKRYRRDFTGGMPTGWGFAPKMEVARVDVDRVKRLIHFRVEAREQAQLVDNAAEIEAKWLDFACLKFVHDSLYDHHVTVVDSFHLMDGQRVFETVVSPEHCDAIHPPALAPGKVL
ncbi:MAG: hypothetical protein R3D67_19900 [Hyphomicrobiaceae bacterium]